MAEVIVSVIVAPPLDEVAVTMYPVKPLPLDTGAFHVTWAVVRPVIIPVIFVGGPGAVDILLYANILSC